MRQVLKAKLEMARFLQETVMKTTGTVNKAKDVPTIVEFQDFLKTVMSVFTVFTLVAFSIVALIFMSTTGSTIWSVGQHHRYCSIFAPL